MRGQRGESNEKDSKKYFTVVYAVDITVWYGIVDGMCGQLTAARRGGS